MKRIAIPLFLGIVLISLQTTLVMFLPIQPIRPDFVLIFTLYLALSYPPISGGVLAFIMGYLTDLFSGNALGFYTLTRPLLFYAVQIYRSRFYLEGFTFQFLLTSVAVLLEGFLILLLLICLNPFPLPNVYLPFFTVLFPQSLVTGLLAPVLFSLFDKGSDFVFRNYDTSLKER
jgi:rod shape-determining protein MreD